MRFAHLHAHSTYSALDGYGTTDQIAARVVELGHTACAQTDHGVIYGHVPWYKSAKAAGIKPVFGCEFYVTENAEDKTKYQKSLGVNAIPHITVLARTQEGYENFLHLVEWASEHGFYYKPRVDPMRIAQFSKGLTVLSGCPGGFPTRLIAEDKVEDARNFIKWLRDNCEDVRVEMVAQPGYGPAEMAAAHLVEIARDLSLPLVMTSDAHFPRPDDWEVQNLMLHIAFKTPVGEDIPVKMPTYQYYCSAEELLVRANDMFAAGAERWGLPVPDRSVLVSAIEAAADLADECNVEVQKAKSIAFPDRGERSADDVLLEWMERGITERLEQGTLDPNDIGRYRERAMREYDVISRKGFSDYMLAISDICRWAKQRNTLVMCRGSAGGSLLLWLLGASETDSLAHDLSFERFYDDTRPDPPDVDVDFETWFRPQVFEYISNKYGKDKCAQILSLSLLRAKIAVVDTANAYKIPRTEYQALTMALDPKDDELDAQIDEQTDPLIIDVINRHPRLRIASRLMGQVRQGTIHAAGMIVSAEPLHKWIAVLRQPGKPPVASCDKQAAADLGLLKFDLLSVSAFDVAANTARRVGLKMDDLYRLKFDDPKVYELAKSGKVCGVFQLDGAALKVGDRIGLDVFAELYAASALCRPGAMDFVDLYQDNKRHIDRFEKFLSGYTPEAAAIVRPTYGVVLYQEQMMAMARNLARMDWPTVHKLRKRVSQASFNGHALNAEYSDPFLNGCEANGIPREEAEHWWDAIKKHGIYSFNKSHCVTYAIVSYWMLWLKAYYPDAYYESFLAMEGAQTSPNMLLMKRLVQEWRGTGGKVQVISKSDPRMTFTSAKPGLIVGGWSNLHGIGEASARRIVDNGPYRTWAELAPYVPSQSLGLIVEAGVTGDMKLNVSKMLRLAPWFPVTETPEAIAETMSVYPQVVSPGALPAGQGVYDAMVKGFISSRHKKGRTGSFKGDQWLYTLEDETGVIIVRVSKAKKELQIDVHDSFEIGDYVVCKGWWTGDDTLFIASFVNIKKWNSN